MIKIIVLMVFLILPVFAGAYDIYDPVTRSLLIPNVRAGTISYKVEMFNQGDLVFKVTKATRISQSPAPSDTFNEASGVLKIPDVSVGTNNFAVEMAHQGDLVFKLTTVNPVETNDFTSKVVTSGLDFPYEVIYGPDKNLWVTERTGKRVTLAASHGERTRGLVVPRRRRSVVLSESER